MRIIAGKWRGRTIAAPSGKGTRPTSARVREALFSMLASRLGSFKDLRVLDLFAGTGALGLEALSRGGAHTTFVENDRRVLEGLGANIAKLDAAAQTTVIPADALHLPRAPGFRASGSVHLAFLDAPYDRGLTQPALDALFAGDWLAPGAFISVETAKHERISASGADLLAERTHGKARLTLLRK